VAFRTRARLFNIPNSGWITKLKKYKNRMLNVNQDKGKTPMKGSANLANIPLPFPYKLYGMLEDSEKNGTESVISWLPGGEWIAIHDPEKFAKEIMKEYFAFPTYKAFVKELYRYGFRKPALRQDEDVLYHDRFIRSNKNLCLSLRRKPTFGKNKMKARRVSGKNIDCKKFSLIDALHDTLHDALHEAPSNDRAPSRCVQNDGLSTEARMLNFEHQEYPASRAQVSHDQDSQSAWIPDYEDIYEPRTIEAMLRDTYGTK
jgi:hypothetical protein